VGFAIPVDLVSRIIPELILHGRGQRRLAITRPPSEEENKQSEDKREKAGFDSGEHRARGQLLPAIRSDASRSPQLDVW